MAITASLIVSNTSAVTATSFTTISWTPTASRLALVSILNRKDSGTPDTPTLTGNSRTYTQVTTASFSTIGTPQRRLTVFRALNDSFTAGALTIDFGSGSQLGCIWHVVEFTGVTTDGANGASAIGQFSTNASTTTACLGIPLSAFSGSDSATYATFGVNQNNVFTAKAGWTLIDDTAGCAMRMGTMFIATNDTAPAASQAGNRNWGGIAIELQTVSASTVGRASATADVQMQFSGSQAYIVGEHRPELFVPDRAGKILPQVGSGSSPDILAAIRALPRTVARAVRDGIMLAR